MKFTDIPDLKREDFIIIEDSQNLPKKRNEKKIKEPKAEATDIEVELPNCEFEPNNLNLSSIINYE